MKRKSKHEQKNLPKKPLRKRKWFWVMIFALVLILGAAGFLLLRHFSQQNSVAFDPLAAPAKPVVYYSPLTGVKVPDEATTKRTVTAVMIENSTDARPQSGLVDAGVVFEAVAEGGITRFLVLYQEAEPQLIGPVRSLRPYYVEWAAPFDPAVAHVGGSARALEMIRSGQYGVDLDQFFNGDSYWRATDRWAPHNVYTDYSHLNSLEQSKNKTTSSFTSWPRRDGEPSAAPSATHIDMDISSGAYFVSYDYDATSNSYVRKQGGTAHTDREKGQIKPTVAIAIKVPMSLGFEDGYREQITTTGSGQAYIFQNGVAIEATWKKADAKSQIQFFAADGSQVELNRGQTWITAVPDDRGVTWQ